MPLFIWEGKNAQGKVLTGQIEAPNMGMVRFVLRRQGITPIKISEKKKDLSEYFSFLQGVKERDLVVFIRQFTAMIAAGVPVVRALDVLQAQQKNKYFSNVIKDIKASVEAGSSLADAFKKYPKIFDELFVNMVAAGETGGVLDQALDRVATYKEKAAALKKKVKGAMVYPMVVLFVAAAVVTLLMIFVIPRFASIFADFGAALPAPTQFVINLSNWFRHNFGLVILAIIGIFVVLKLIRRTKKGRYLTDKLLLKFPLFGDLIKKTAIARFSRTLSTMLQSGVPILQGLEIVAKTAGNKVIEEILYVVRSDVSAGETLGVSLNKAKVFPPLVVQMASVGEETGELEAMLSKVADFYEEEVDVAVDALTSMLEPMLMVVLGGLVGGLVIALYLPIFKLGSVVGG